MIALRGIVKRYAMGEEIVLALDGVDLDIGRNEYVALTGPSGSGKSTLMNLIGCLDSPSEGSYTLNGRDVSGMDDVELAHVRNREIGFVFQSFHLLPRMTVLQNVMQPLVYRGLPVEERRARAAAALAKVGLADRLGHRPNQLSGGQRQRVAIARVLLKDAPILVLDEATSALDSEVEAAIQEQLYDLMEGKTVIAIAHRLSTIAVLDRLIVMDGGRVIESGSHEELLQQDGLYAALWRRQSGGFIGVDLEDAEA